MCKFQHLLTSTSRNIFNLTKGRIQVKDVVVRLPLSWHSCAPSTAVVTDSKTDAEVKVTSAHPLLGDMPWTLQYAGCHQPGKNIEIPVGFLAKNKSIEEKSSLLAREWVKLQFGVFEENGFDNDNLSPTTFAEGKTNMTNSGCDIDDNQGEGAEDDDEECVGWGQLVIAASSGSRYHMTYASPN